jgi:ABC-type bacteriocin/lantibiotic exporter with double-glycine peptidase domain
MDTLKIIKPFLYENKKILILYTIFVLLSYPLESVVIPNMFGAFFKIIESGITNENIYDFLKKITLLVTITNIAQTICSKLDTIIIPRFNEFTTNKLFEKILKFYESNYADLELGKILARINSIPSILREMTTDLFNWIIPKILTIIIINLYFTYHNKTLGLISFLFLFGILYYNYNKYIDCIELSNKRYLMYEEKSESVQDKLSNLYAIYSASKVNEEINDFKSTTNTFKTYQTDAMACSNNIKNTNNLLTLIFFVFILYYTADLTKKNIIGKEQLVSIYMMLIFYIPCLNTIITYLPDYTNHMGIISSVNEYIKLINVDIPEKPNINVSQGEILINNLSFGYSKYKNIFENFNLNIKSKSKIAIVGPSGNGKSTLIKLIMGYYMIPDNSIFIDGQDINKYNLGSLRSQISYINQNTKLFNKTIYENIQYGNTMTKDDINNLINKYELEQIFKNIPSGFDTNVGVSGDSLSGGQKQIIQLLRCYNKNNKILILDEPTSALDSTTKTAVINIIKDISKDSTLIIITHDDNNLELVNRTIKIVNGKIVN